GAYIDSSNNQQGLLLTQTSGKWATGVKAPLPAGAAPDPGVALRSVSCASAGNCTAVGNYPDSSGRTQALLLTRTSGHGTAAEPPVPAHADPDAGVVSNSVSCGSAGNCTAVGNYLGSPGRPHGLLLTQTSGHWTAAKAPLPANAAPDLFVDLLSVSCASAGNCTAVGAYTDSSTNQQGLLLIQTSGHWTAAEAPVPPGAAADPLADPNWVSCGSAGNCPAVGDYLGSPGHRQGLLLIQTSGSWAAAQAPLPAGAAAARAFAFLPSVSCASAGNCTAVG